MRSTPVSKMGSQSFPPPGAFSMRTAPGRPARKAQTRKKTVRSRKTSKAQRIPIRAVCTAQTPRVRPSISRRVRPMRTPFWKMTATWLGIRINSVTAPIRGSMAAVRKMDSSGRKMAMTAQTIPSQARHMPTRIWTIRRNSPRSRRSRDSSIFFTSHTDVGAPGTKEPPPPATPVPEAGV